jgi:hypothetical protein
MVLVLVKFIILSKLLYIISKINARSCKSKGRILMEEMDERSKKYIIYVLNNNKFIKTVTPFHSD